MKETKEVLALGLAIGNALGSSLADGKIDLSDLPRFVGIVPVIAPAIMGIEHVDDELREAMANDFDELVEYAKSEFDIPQDRVENAVEYALEIGVKVVRLVATLKT